MLAGLQVALPGLGALHELGRQRGVAQAGGQLGDAEVGDAVLQGGRHVHRDVALGHEVGVAGALVVAELRVADVLGA